MNDVLVGMEYLDGTRLVGIIDDYAMIDSDGYAIVDSDDNAIITQDITSLLGGEE